MGIDLLPLGLLRYYFLLFASGYLKFAVLLRGEMYGQFQRLSLVRPYFYSQAKGPMWICGCSGNLQVLSLSITHSGTGDITTGLVSGPSGPTEVGLG